MNLYRQAFGRVANKVANLVNDPQAKFLKAYTYEKAPALEKMITGIMEEFRTASNNLVMTGTANSWILADKKNDRIFSDYLKNVSRNVGTDVQSLFFAQKATEGLRSYLMDSSSKVSQRVWNISNQFEKELQVHLAIGIMQGDSAQVISQRIRQYLNNPDALFRRVRDAEGKLIPSQAMEAFHPGQGVYRSAYKNAMRVARTETNMAYLRSDCDRWSNSRIVMGIEIRLSASHPNYNFEEICEELEGDYPADFLFEGWHPHCLCNASPILIPEDEFMDYLSRKISLQELTDKYKIKEPPESFRNYVQAHSEKLAESEAYWVRDNRDLISKYSKIEVPEQTSANAPIDYAKKDFLNDPGISQILDKFQNGKYNFYNYEDPVLKDLALLNNMDGTPQVLVQSTFDNAVGMKAFRGLGSNMGESYCNQFMRGEYFAGKGIYGQGTYMAVTKEGVAITEREALTVARDYSGSVGRIMEIKIPPNVKMIKMNEIEEEMMQFLHGFVDKNLDEAWAKVQNGQMTNVEFKSFKKKVESFNELINDPGRYAAFRGYDGIIKEFKSLTSCDYGVWLNRSKLLVKSELINPETLNI